MKVARFTLSFLSIGLFLILFSCSSSVNAPNNNSMAFYATLSTKKVNHPLYRPGESNIPHPIPFYSDMADEPVYPYPNACGTASLLFDPDTKELQYAISYSGLSGQPIMLHFHLGGPKVEGPIIQTVFGEPYKDVKGLGNSTEPPLYGKKGPKSRAGFITGTYKLKGNPLTTPPLSAEEEVQKLMKGELYINIHTYLNELGEIRGQIESCSEKN